MSTRKAPPRPRAGTGEPSEAGHYHQPESPYYYQSAPTQQQPQQHMAYTAYPPRQHYGHPYPPHYANRNMGPGDPMASSSPQGGFHPPLHRYPPRGRNLTAVTPDSGHVVPADFMSPPSNVKRRALTPGSSLSPSKKARTGTFFNIIFSLHPCEG